MAKKQNAGTKKTSKKESKEYAELYENARNFDLVEDKEIISGVADEAAPETVKRTSRLTHFDVIKMMFTNQQEFNNLTNSTLQSVSFMVNRTFSIKYPLQAQFFNVLNINGADMVRYWQKFITAKEGYGTCPSFIYTGGASKQKASKAKTKAEQLDKETINEYCKFYHLSLKDFNDMLYFYNDETVEDIEKFEKKRSKSEQAKMFKSGRSTANLDD